LSTRELEAAVPPRILERSKLLEDMRRRRVEFL
jgi:hypothetical protein